MTPPSSTHEALVRAWAADLRAGSARRWSEFRDTGSPGIDSGPVPGAAQLELVRQLPKDLPDFGELADLVLATAGPGRGLGDVPLPGAPVAFGTPPIEPEAVPVDELIRIACGALVALLARDVPVGVEPPLGQWRPWKRSVVVLGAPMTASVLRGALRARGLRSGGSRSTYLVLGEPLENLMAQRWSARISAGAGMRWERMWRTAVVNDRLPPGVQLGAITDGLVSQFGASAVHVVLGADRAEVLSRAGNVLGIELGALDDPPAASPLATDLLRRLNPLLTLAVGEDGRRRVAEQVWPEVAAADDTSGRRLGLGAPSAVLPWAISAGEHLAAELSAGDYAVHGDPGLVVPVHRDDIRRTVDPDDVVTFALGVLGRTWVLNGVRPLRSPSERQA